MEARFQTPQIVTVVKCGRSENAQIDSCRQQQFRLMFWQMLSRKEPNAGISQQFNGRVKRCIAGDLQLDELKGLLPDPLSKIDRAATIRSTGNQT